MAGWHIINRMNTRVYVSILVQNADGEVLLVKRSSDSKFAPGQWEFINGSIDPGETAEQTAVRELIEEAGIGIDQSMLTPGKIYETTDADGRWVVLPFKVTVQDADVTISPEHTDYQWLSVGDISSIDDVASDFASMNFND